MARHYKNQGIMKVLTILGGIVGLLTIILGLFDFNYAFVNALVALDQIVIIIVGIIVSIITIWAGLKPNNPIPFHWVMLIVLAVLLIVFGAGVLACVLVIIAALIGIIEDL